MPNDQTLSQPRRTPLGSQALTAHPMDTMCYVTAVDEIVAELEQIRQLLAREFGNTRALAKTQEGLQGLVVSEREVEDLLSRPIGDFGPSDSECDRDSETLRRAGNQDAAYWPSNRLEINPSEMRLGRLARAFELTPFDVTSLLIALSVDLD